MALGQTIGRVSIKVAPDTSTFRRELEAKLEVIERGLEVKVKAVLDTKSLERSLLEGIRALNAENKTKESHKVRVYTRLETDLSEVKKVIREYEAMARARGGVKIPSQMAAGKVKLELDEQSLRDVKDKLDDFRRRNDPIRIRVRVDLDDVSDIEARLAALARNRTVRISPRMNESAHAKVLTALAALGGARVLRNVFRSINTQLKNLDQNVPIIGAIASAVQGVGMWAATAASNLFSLSSSLASIGPAVLLLPGIFGGIAIGVGATVAAFKDFSKVFPDVKAKMAALQDLVSKNFWTVAKEPVRKLIDEMLPIFTRNLSNTATMLGGFFGNLAGDLTNKLGPALDGMFENLNKSIQIFTDHTGAIAGIITTLGKVGASVLPRLANAFGGLLTKFDKFLAAADKDGRLKEWTDTAIEAIKDLGRVLSNVGGIFAGIARAATAAGGSTLDSLANTLERIHAVVDTPAFQMGLTNFLRAAHEGMDKLTNSAGPALLTLFQVMGENAGKIFPQIGLIVGNVFRMIAEFLSNPAFVNGMTDMFLSLTGAVRKLSPVIAPLAEAFGAIMTIIGELAQVMAPLLVAALVPLSKMFTDLAPLLTPIIRLLGKSFADAVKDLTPFLEALTPVLGELMTEGFAALARVMPGLNKLFKEFVDKFGPVLLQALKDLAPLLEPLSKAFADMLLAATPLIPKLAKLAEKILPLLPGLVQSIIDNLPEFVRLFTKLCEVALILVEVFTKIVEFIMPLLLATIQTFSDMSGSVMDGISDIIEGFINHIKGIWMFFTGILTGDWQKAWDGIKKIVSAMKDTIIGIVKVLGKGVITALVNAIKDSVPLAWAETKKFAAMIGNWCKDLYFKINKWCTDVLTAIRDWSDGIGESIEKWIKDTWNAIVKWCSDVLGKFTGWISSVATKIRNGFTGFVTTVRDKLYDMKMAVINKGGEIIAWFRALPGKVVSGIGNIGSLLKQKGIDLIQGFVDGIQKMATAPVDAVKNIASNVASKATFGILDFGSPSRLMKKYGGWVTQGLVDGMTADAGRVLTTASSLADTLVSGVGRADIAGIGDDAGTSFIESLVAAIRSGFPDLARSLSAIDAPGIGQVEAARGIGGSVAGAIGGGNAAVAVVNKTLIYNAAPGSSLGSEEDLFAASSRTRMVGW